MHAMRARAVMRLNGRAVSFDTEVDRWSRAVFSSRRPPLRAQWMQAGLTNLAAPVVTGLGGHIDSGLRRRSWRRDDSEDRRP